MKVYILTSPEITLVSRNKQKIIDEIRSRFGEVIPAASGGGVVTRRGQIVGRFTITESPPEAKKMYQLFFKDDQWIFFILENLQRKIKELLTQDQNIDSIEVHSISD